jgi:hypothetical protein
MASLRRAETAHVALRMPVVGAATRPCRITERSDAVSEKIAE